MDYVQFQKQLRETGSYKTVPVRHNSLGNRLFSRFSLWYYWKLLRVVTAARSHALRGKYNNGMWAASSFAYLTAVEGTGGMINISGIEHLNGCRGPFVYVSNHMSMLETFLLPVILLSIDGLSTVVKTSLCAYPLFGPILRACRPICVDRENPRQDLKQVLTRGVEVLRERSVLVFPQSTRRPYVDPLEFNSLGTKLAARAGVSAVPVALKTDFHGIGRPLKDLGRIDRSKAIHFKFGPPLPISGNGKTEHRRIVEFISENLRTWGAEKPPAQK